MTRELETWLRQDFVELNTELEEAYFAARSDVLVRPDLEDAKRELVRVGGELIARVDDTPDRYRLLGAVGLYLAACGRHGVEPPRPAWTLAQFLGSSLGVAPRYVFAHQSTHNPAERGIYRRFTALADEQVFVTYNGLAVLAYQRAADVLRRIPPMGVSHPMVAYLLEQARSSLADVLRFNRTLAETLDADRFYFNIRPYFRPHRVGELVHRGVNAGDFSSVNEIDLLLGLASAKDPFYQSVVAEKYAFVPPEDQPLLRQAMGERSLLEKFLTEPVSAQLRTNGELFLAVCRAHGAAYAFHHHRLVKPFLEAKATGEDVTASGPPLSVVMAGLDRLRRLRTSHPDLTRLREHLGPAASSESAGDRARGSSAADHATPGPVSATNAGP